MTWVCAIALQIFVQTILYIFAFESFSMLGDSTTVAQIIGPLRLMQIFYMK